MTCQKGEAMPLSDWVLRLLTRRKDARAADVVPVPAIPDALATGPAPAKAPPQPLPPDNSTRIHLAATDPAFPARREAGFDVIVAAVGEVVLRHGYVAKAKSWVRAGPGGIASVQVQRSRYGFECTLHLGFEPATGPREGIWADEDTLSLDHFLAPGEVALQPGTLIYLDALDNPASLDLPMNVLDNRALPWLEDQINGVALPG